MAAFSRIPPRHPRWSAFSAATSRNRPRRTANRTTLQDAATASRNSRPRSRRRRKLSEAPRTPAGPGTGSEARTPADGEAEPRPGGGDDASTDPRRDEPAPDSATPAAAAADAAATANEDGAATPAAAGKPGWRERLRGSGFARSLGGLFSRNPRLDDDLLDEIETALLTADVGVAATTGLLDQLRRRMAAREFADADALLRALRDELVELLRPVAVPLAIDADARPFVLLTVGVNGVGKTTTIGKLARRFGRRPQRAAGRRRHLPRRRGRPAAGWGERNGRCRWSPRARAPTPPRSIFDALQAGQGARQRPRC
jgi:fused signal recognition particle receptor